MDRHEQEDLTRVDRQPVSEGRPTAASHEAAQSDYERHRHEVSDANRAEIIARLAHAGQKDRVTGRPYVEHPSRVAWEMPDEDEDAQAVAWLHDVVEDSPLSLHDLVTLGFAPRIVRAVDLLTRREETRHDYAGYIEQIATSGDRLAVLVKIGDLRDHLTPHCQERLRPRYEEALRRLSVVLPAAGRESVAPTPEADPRAGETNPSSGDPR